MFTHVEHLTTAGSVPAVYGRGYRLCGLSMAFCRASSPATRNASSPWIWCTGRSECVWRSNPRGLRLWWRGIILRLWVVLVSSGVSPVLVAWRKIISRYIFRLQYPVTSTLSERRAAATTWVAGRYGTPEINVCRGRKGAPGRIQTCDTGFNNRPMQRLPLGRDCCCRRTAFVCLPSSSAIEDSHLFLVTRDE